MLCKFEPKKLQIMKTKLLLFTIGTGLFIGCQNGPQTNNNPENNTTTTSSSTPVDTVSKIDNSNFNVSISPETEELLKNLKVEKDEFKQLSFYEHKKQPKGWCNDVSIYIVREGAEMFGRLKIKYNAEDWLFVENVQFLCDDVPVTYIPATSWEHDNSGGEVFEYNDAVITNDIKPIIESIINAKKVKIRCNGDQYYDDRTMSEGEKNRLKEMYEILY